MKVVNKSDSTKTVLTITVGFIAIYLMTRVNWVLYLALFIGLCGVLSPFLSRKIDFLWMKLTLLLSYIVPNILLSVIFYFFLFPVALLSKVFGKKDPLKIKKTEGSLYVSSEKEFSKSSFEKTW